MRSAYQLRDLKGPVDLYTRRADVDVIVDTETHKEYIRGKMVLFEKVKNYVPFPPLVEDNPRYQLVSEKAQRNFNKIDFLREMVFK